MKIRLNKFIADSGVASRRKAEDFILEGRVEVNDETVIDLSKKVDATSDVVKLDGEIITQKEHLYYLLNKPKGFLTTTSDERNRKTVVDLLNVNEKIFPVGRLDYNTTGTLILTNDGDFKQLLTHPRNKVPRVYDVKLNKPLEENDKIKLLKGIFINGVRGKFTRIIFPVHNNFKIVEVTSVEGRNHFVKNMFSTLGYLVKTLNRKSFGGISADIPVGQFRKLTKKEINKVISQYA